MAEFIDILFVFNKKKTSRVTWNLISLEAVCGKNKQSTQTTKFIVESLVK